MPEALLYDASDSPFCMKARMCLHVKAIPFRSVAVTLRRLPELRRLNALGKVPVLVHDGEVIADSSAIARWAEARRPDPVLLPGDPAVRAYCTLLEEWADEALYFIVGGFKWLNPENRAAALTNTVTEICGGPLRPLVGRVLARRVRHRYAVWGYRAAQLGQLEARMRENLGALAGLLGDRPYLLGRSATLADVAAFAQLAWMRRYAERRLLDDVPRVVDWMERVEAAPPIAESLGLTVH
jgi:glutathione S-transferase